MLRPSGAISRPNVGAFSWGLILVMTVAYHLGYSDFRSRKLVEPIIGNTLISIPTLISANPVGSPIAHAAMHIAAVVHAPKTEVFLSPHRESVWPSAIGQRDE